MEATSLDKPDSPPPALSPEALMGRLAEHPREPLCHLPTPLEPMPRLAKIFGGPALYVKRDDQTGLALGGNKLRKLEYLLGHARAQGADCVVTGGVPQSNHVRQAAAACAKLGLDCHVAMMTGRVPIKNEAYERSGNALVTRLLGAVVREVAWTGDRNATLEEVADQLRRDGHHPYVVPYGGSNARGALGAVHCAAELVQQIRDSGLDITALVHCSGSAGTQAGLAVGLAAVAPQIRLIGIDIDAEPERVRADVERIAAETAEMLGFNDLGKDLSIDVRAGYAGPAYGVTAPETIEAIELAATSEGLITDPVYSGKGLAGLIGLIRKHEFTPRDGVVFLHTGGVPGLFAYADAFW